MDEPNFRQRDHKMQDLGDVRSRIPTNGGDWFDRFEEVWTRQLGELKEKFGSAVSKSLFPGKDLTDVPVIYVKRDRILEVLEFMKTADGFRYDFLSDLSATDETPNKKRFEVVYQLFSYKEFYRFRVKVQVGEKEKIPSAVSLWAAANWVEREVFDMFGIEFEGHPDLRRILMDMRWKGHPLRKDYPLKGYQIFPTPEPINPELLK